MKIGKNLFATALLTVLIASLAAPALANAEPSAHHSIRIANEDKHWKKIETDIITVLFPADGRKPMFLWWYTNEPEKVYVVKFQGLIEYFTFEAQFYRKRYESLPERLHDRFIQPRLWQLRRGIIETLQNLYMNWHLPYLPFNACNWTLMEPEPITSNGIVIGYAFAFNLNKAPTRRFQFAQNNILIKCRFYNTTVEEQVKNGDDNSPIYTYNVGPGEMKIDFVVKNWDWNVDLLKPLLSDLEEAGITLPPYKSGLALWINLASINAIKIKDALNAPEEVESMSTASYITVDGTRVFVRPNNADEDERPLMTQKRLHEHCKLQFATEDTTLAGFFKFVASAKLTNDTGSYKVPVNASYIEAGAHMRLFICYPYFEGTLEHDPSIGVDAPETVALGTAKPEYTVEAPSGTQIVPKVVAIFTAPLVTIHLVAVLLAAASAIAIIALAAKRKGKLIDISRLE